MAHLSALPLPSPLGHHYYTTFYVLAFLLNQALLLWIGYRRGYPLRSWLLLTTGVTLAFIVGTKLIAAPGTDWSALWQHGQWPAGTARSVLGGAVGGVLAGLALRRWLGYGWHALDAFCLPSALAYALQCVGCLLTGCCFGHVADWGVCYAPDTLPFLAQVERGLIPMTAAHSLPVVPTQALSGLLVLGVGGLLWMLRHRPWPGGSWRLLQAALLVAARFAVEFWRDPAGEQVGADVVPVLGLALKQVQWALLPLLGLFGWAWWHRTRPRAAAPAPEIIPANHALRNLLGVAAMLLLTAVLGPAAFTLPEVLVVKAGLTVVLVTELAALLRQGLARPWRLGLPLGLASAVLLFTNQVPADSAGGRPFVTLGLGSAVGGYDENRVVEPPSGGCSGSSGGVAQRRAYYHRHTATGGTITYWFNNPNRSLTSLGLGVWRGTDRIGTQTIPVSAPYLTNYTPDSTRRYQLFSVNPYVTFREAEPSGDFFVDGRIGLHIGRLAYPHKKKSFDLSPFPALPDLMVRLGKPGGFFGQLETGYGPAAVGNFSGRAGLGAGLRTAYSDYFLVGVGTATHYPGGAFGFVGGRIWLGRTGLALEPYAATNFDRLYQLSGQLYYRLPAGRR